MGQVLFHALALFSGGGFDRRPHGRKFSIADDCRDLELNPKAFDPRAKVCPHLADVASYSDGNTTTADRLAHPVLQLEAVEAIAMGSSIDVLGKPRAGLPGPIDGGKRPNDQVVLHRHRSNDRLLARPALQGN